MIYHCLPAQRRWSWVVCLAVGLSRQSKPFQSKIGTLLESVRNERSVMLFLSSTVNSASVSSTHTHSAHTLRETYKQAPDIAAWKCLNTMFTLQFHCLDIVLRNSQKCISRAYNFQNFLGLVSRGLRLIAMNMYYAKFTLWTPN